ncbi:MAG: GC-type dockerin domain-anchored protein [Phycisphaerales bacterium]
MNDFVCFLNRFSASHPQANCDMSTIPPVLNVNDFVCFLQQFAANCS